MVIEQLKIYHANRLTGSPGQPVHHTYFRHLNDMENSLKNLPFIKAGSQIIFTTISKSINQVSSSPHRKLGELDKNQVGSPSGALMGKDRLPGFANGNYDLNRANGKALGQGLKRAKSLGSKGLDEQGLPLKKQKSQKKAKVIEEVSLYYRVR